MTKKIFTNSAKETQKVAAKFVKQILRQESGPDCKVPTESWIHEVIGTIEDPRCRLRRAFAIKSEHSRDKSAAILALQGDLGSGKTTFLQGFAKELGIKEKILSPTFILMKKFIIPQNKSFGRCLTSSEFRGFYHFDCYRLNKPKEILNLGFREIISDPQNIVAIEWPERIKNILPKNKILIKFEHLEKNHRKLTIWK